MSKPVAPFTVYRSSMQLGTRKVGEAWHVEYRIDFEVESIASLWVGDRQPSVVARGRADQLADKLNRELQGPRP